MSWDSASATINSCSVREDSDIAFDVPLYAGVVVLPKRQSDKNT